MYIVGDVPYAEATPTSAAYQAVRMRKKPKQCADDIK